MKLIYSPILAHHGINGQKWGVRRYQYKDGSLTPAGQKRYKKEEVRSNYKRDTISKGKKSSSKSPTIRIENKVSNKSAKYTKEEVRSNYKRDTVSKGNKIYKTESPMIRIENKVSDKSAKYTKEEVRSDYISSGDSITNLYKNIKSKKGKDYVDRIERKVGHKPVRFFVSETVSTTGSSIATNMLSNR